MYITIVGTAYATRYDFATVNIEIITPAAPERSQEEIAGELQEQERKQAQDEGKFLNDGDEMSNTQEPQQGDLENFEEMAGEEGEQMAGQQSGQSFSGRGE